MVLRSSGKRGRDEPSGAGADEETDEGSDEESDEGSEEAEEKTAMEIGPVSEATLLTDTLHPSLTCVEAVHVPEDGVQLPTRWRGQVAHALAQHHG